MFHILTTINLPLYTPYIIDILREKKYLELFFCFQINLRSIGFHQIFYCV